MHVRISVKIGGIPFSELLRGFMLLSLQKGTFRDFCIERFRNSVIFSYLESFYTVKLPQNSKFYLPIAKFGYQQMKVIGGTLL